MKKIALIMVMMILLLSMASCSGEIEQFGQSEQTTQIEPPSPITLTKDNVFDYIVFDGQFVDGRVTSSSIGYYIYYWSYATLDFQTYPAAKGTFQNVEITFVATSDAKAFGPVAGNSIYPDMKYWHLEEASEGEDDAITITVRVPLDGEYSREYSVICSRQPLKLSGKCDFEILSVTGTFTPSN